MFAPSVFAQDAARPLDLHVRTANWQLLAMMSAGRQVSPTLHGIIKRIELSDVIVYLDSHLLTTPGVAAQSQFVSTTNGHRYVRVIIDSAIHRRAAGRPDRSRAAARRRDCR